MPRSGIIYRSVLSQFTADFLYSLIVRFSLRSLRSVAAIPAFLLTFVSLREIFPSLWPLRSFRAVILFFVFAR